MIVTAEPYSAARQPSDVVVLENEIRPDTVGQIKEIQAKYELMPRGHYTWDVANKLKSDDAGVPKVSMDRYEALLELYEARNAAGIARAANAQQYAPQTYQKAQDLLAEAQRLQDSKAASSLVVQMAREAAQTAEDSRVIAEKRRQEEKVATLADRGRAGAARPVTGRKRGPAGPHRCRCGARGSRLRARRPPTGRSRCGRCPHAWRRSRPYVIVPAPPPLSAPGRLRKTNAAYAAAGTTQWCGDHA